MSLDKTIQSLESGNRIYEPHYLAKGESALIMRALRFFMAEQQRLIQAEHEQSIRPYASRDKNPPAAKRARFEDVKRHHDKQIEAAGRLFDRFRDGSVRKEIKS